MATAPPNLVTLAREVHHQLLEARGGSRAAGYAKAAQDSVQAQAPRYEHESFDVSCGAPPPLLQSRLPPMVDVISAARVLVDEHVFGDVRTWMNGICGELAGGVGAEFVVNLWWWQCVLDHVQLRSQRVMDTAKRDAELPFWERRTRTSAYDVSRNVPLAAVYASNCIEDEQLDLGAEDAGGAEAEGGDGGGAKSLAHRIMQRGRARRRPSQGGGGGGGPSETEAAADDSSPASSSPSSGRVGFESTSSARRAGSNSSRSRPGGGGGGPTPASLHGGLPGLFHRMSRGYRALFLAVTHIAARATNQGHAAPETLAVPRPSDAAAAAEEATLRELLSVSGTLRDRACSYFRAVVVEAVVVLFHAAWAGSTSLGAGSLLHFPLLRERVARTVDEIMFGTLAPPGMVVWAPSTCGISLPPHMPADKAAGGRASAAGSLSSAWGGGAAAGDLLAPTSRPTLLARSATAVSSGAFFPGASPRSSSRMHSPARSAATHRGRGWTPGGGSAAAVGGGVEDEWSRLLRAQLDDALRTLDAGTRLSLLMPLVPPGLGVEGGGAVAASVTGIAPDPVLRSSSPPAAPHGGAGGGGLRDDAFADERRRHHPAASLSSASSSRLPWVMSTPFSLPCPSELRAKRHALRIAEKAKLELGDPASAAIQHVLDVRASARKKRLPDSEEKRSLADLRREILRPAVSSSSQGGGGSSHVPRMVPKVVKEAGAPGVGGVRRGSISGLHAGPFKSRQAAAAFGKGGHGSPSPEASPRRLANRRGSHTVVSAVDVGTRNTTTKTSAGLSDVSARRSAGCMKGGCRQAAHHSLPSLPSSSSAGPHNERELRLLAAHHVGHRRALGPARAALQPRGAAPRRPPLPQRTRARCHAQPHRPTTRLARRDEHGGGDAQRVARARADAAPPLEHRRGVATGGCLPRSALPPQARVAAPQPQPLPPLGSATGGGGAGASDHPAQRLKPPPCRLTLTALPRRSAPSRRLRATSARPRRCPLSRASRASCGSTGTLRQSPLLPPAAASTTTAAPTQTSPSSRASEPASATRAPAAAAQLSWSRKTCPHPP